MFLVDSHCHLDMLDLTQEQGDINKIIDRAKDNNVHYILNVCVTIKDFPTVLKTAERFSNVCASVGLHPNEKDEEITEKKLIQLGEHQKVVAIGETGLDYYRTSGDTEWQRERFRLHIRAAKQLQKPLIIHTRDAKIDTIRILQEEEAEGVAGVMHCFTEDWETAKEALDMGFYISFSGIVTFKNAHSIQEVAKRVPLQKLLIETDSPYLAPEPYRGKRNEPAYVRYTAEYLAALKDVTLQQFAEQTTQNFFNLFRGAKRPHV
jgi:TatD DNase family protein